MLLLSSVVMAAIVSELVEQACGSLPEQWVFIAGKCKDITKPFQRIVRFCKTLRNS